jgi:hypothetical protein
MWNGYALFLPLPCSLCFFRCSPFLTNLPVVLLCTSALFISGCLIQQRTLRDLRTAIRPIVVTRPKPKVWDTEALKRRQQRSTIKLEDGTRVQIHQGGSSYNNNNDDDDEDVELMMPKGKIGNENENENEYVDVEVRPSAPDNENGEGDEEERKSRGNWDGVQEGGEPLSRAERRRRIKAEIERLSKGDTPIYYQRRLW